MRRFLDARRCQAADAWPAYKTIVQGLPAEKRLACYRQFAEEARASAEQCRDALAKVTFLKLAANYEELADAWARLVASEAGR